MATYNPAVNDRSGEIRAAGLADAFKTFAGYGMQGMQWGRDNRQRTEDMAFKREMFGAQQAAQEQQFAMANARDQQRFAMEMQSQQMAQDERKAMAAERKAESLAEADGLTAAVLQSFGPRISEEERARVAAMPPPARKAWALTQSKLIPQLLQDEQTRLPITTLPLPGGGGAIMQGPRFLGQYSGAQQQRPMEPEKIGIDQATGQPVYGSFGLGPDGQLAFQRAPLPPGVVAAAPRPERPPTMVPMGQDKEGNPLFGTLVPDVGGFKFQQVAPNTVIPFGQRQPAAPSASAPSSSGSRPYYSR